MDPCFPSPSILLLPLSFCLLPYLGPSPSLFLLFFLFIFPYLSTPLFLFLPYSSLIYPPISPYSSPSPPYSPSSVSSISSFTSPPVSPFPSFPIPPNSSFCSPLFLSQSPLFPLLPFFHIFFYLSTHLSLPLLPYSP